jgi:hypothetical protein
MRNKSAPPLCTAKSRRERKFMSGRAGNNLRSLEVEETESVEGGEEDDVRWDWNIKRAVDALRRFPRSR